MTKYLEIGQIVNTFGIKGMVKIKPFTDNIKRFDKLKELYDFLFAAKRNKTPNPKKKPPKNLKKKQKKNYLKKKKIA